MFNVVLIEPEIPPNTGNIGRLCLATRSRLHLVKPLGFSLEDRQLKRAGLDYWDEVNVRLWDSFAQLQSKQKSNARYFFLTTKAQRAYYDVKFHEGDFLVFGRETKGLAENLLAKNIDNCHHPDARDAQPEPRDRSRNCAVRSSATTDLTSGDCKATSAFCASEGIQKATLQR